MSKMIKVSVLMCSMFIFSNAFACHPMTVPSCKDCAKHCKSHGDVFSCKVHEAAKPGDKARPLCECNN